jgi:hypothetical protein
MKHVDEKQGPGGRGQRPELTSSLVCSLDKLAHQRRILSVLALQVLCALDFFP